MAGGGGEVTEGVLDQLSDETKVLIGLGVGVGLTLGGIILIWDDIKDVPTFATERHVSPIHHWWIGLLLFLAGVLILGITAIFLLSVLQKS